jgi:hypothetical protein
MSCVATHKKKVRHAGMAWRGHIPGLGTSSQMLSMGAELAAGSMERMRDEMVLEPAAMEALHTE